MITRQQLIQEIHKFGNLRDVLTLLKHDQVEVTKFLKSAGPDTFQKVQGRISILDEYVDLITNALR
jgi:hypothetical protein